MTVTLPWKDFASDDDYHERVAALRKEAATIPQGDAGLEHRRALMPRLTALNTEAGTAGGRRRGIAAHPSALPCER